MDVGSGSTKRLMNNNKGLISFFLVCHFFPIFSHAIVIFSSKSFVKNYPLFTKDGIVSGILFDPNSSVGFTNSFSQNGKWWCTNVSFVYIDDDDGNRQ